MGKIFKRGLIAIAPLTISLALIIWFFRLMEEMMRVPLIGLFGEKFYFPGLGILVALVFIFIVGIVINTYIVQKVSSWSEKLFSRIPFFKTFYNSIGDLMSYFRPQQNAKKEGRVVVVHLSGVRVLGLITREDFDELPEHLGKEGEIAVYIPMSYQIGGFTVFISRTKIELLDMTVEEGMRFAVTAGMTGRKPPKHS